MTTLPYSGTKTATTTQPTTDIDTTEPVALPFDAGGKRVVRTRVQQTTKREVTTPPAPEPEAQTAQPGPSTYEPDGWRPWNDRRDADGFTFSEWATNCQRVEAGQEPLAPAHPRQRGLFPPVERKPEVAETEGARKRVTANGVTVTRLDAYKRKPSKKTRELKTAATGAKWVKARDLAVIEFVVAWGFLSRTQTALLLGYTPAGITRRINKLVTLGLLTRQYGIDGHYRYSATAAGRRLAGMEGMTTPTLSMLRWDHHEACIAAALMLKHQYPDAVIITEREATAAAYGPDGKVGPGGTLSPRLRRLAPWLQTQTGGDYSRWVPRIYSKSGTAEGRKYPDLLIARPGKLPQAVEVELTEKSRRSAYRDAVSAYNEAAESSHLDATVLYLTSPASSLSDKRLRSLLDAATHDAGLQASAPPRFEFIDIPVDIWVPTAVRVRRKASQTK